MTSVSESPKFMTKISQNLFKPKAKKDEKADEKKDVFKDTPLRCVGFLDEIGESLRPILSTSNNPLVKQLPNIAYIPATAYIVADVAHKYKQGEDGTGKKPSFKVAGREALYQGIVSIAAPMMIGKGVNKLTHFAVDKASGKMPQWIKNVGSSIAEKLSKFKFTSKLMNKANMPAKILSALITITALTKLAKPVDKITSKVFEKTIDPMLGLNKKEAKVEETENN